MKTLINQIKEDLTQEIDKYIKQKEQYMKDFNGISDPIHRTA